VQPALKVPWGLKATTVWTESRAQSDRQVPKV